MDEITAEEALQLYGYKAWSEYSLGRIKIKGLPIARNYRQSFIGCLCPKCGVTLTIQTRDFPPQGDDDQDWEEREDYWSKWSNVEISHKFPRSGFPELMFDMNNWEIMCAKCNRRDGVIFSEHLIKKGEKLSKNILSKFR